MVDENTVNCLREAEIDTIEIALRKRMEEHLSNGDIETAELIEETVKSLDKINVCDESSKWIRELAYKGEVKDIFGR